MNDELLTENEKAAIKRYMISIVAVPGVVITLGAGFTGYLWNKSEQVTKESALLETQVQAQSILNAVRDDIGRLSTDSKIALAHAKRDQVEISTGFQRLRTIMDSLEGVSDIESVISSLEEKIIISDSFQETVASKIKPPEIVMSEIVKTPGDCVEPKKVVIGKFPSMKFCALSQNLTYRHGENKGQVYCQVSLQNSSWVLAAYGPSDNCSSKGGATSGSCQAICWI